MKLWLTDIAELHGLRSTLQVLRGNDLSNFPSIKEAWICIENERIVDYGSMQDWDQQNLDNSKVVSIKGSMVLPCWCDSHTHLVFAGSREQEMIYKIKGMGYAEIAAKGGGILSTATTVEESSEDALYEAATARLKKIIGWGTGAVEIKSGYGLSLENELKMLRVIQRLKNNSPIPIKATFLGAHAYPLAYRERKLAYIDLIVHEMIPAVAHEHLADYVDVFCEEGFFSLSDTRRIVEAALKFGMKPRLHVNQLTSSGGLQLAVELGSISADHLEMMTEEDISCIASSSTIATLLPTAAYFLRAPYPPARKLIEAGAAVAIASDFNPGSSPNGNMQHVVNMSCIQMKMTPEEAFQAATFQGACSMELQHEVGSIAKGKLANIIITKSIPSLAYIPYSFGENHIQDVVIRGRFLSEE